MLQALLKRLQESQNSGVFFYKVELLLAVVFGIAIWWLRPKNPESGFRVRESDLRSAKKPKGSVSGPDALPDALAEARIRRPKAPIQLEGIAIQGAAHEVLGVSANANASEVQQAYRNLMKRYHPDKVGLAGSREWKDTQKIAKAINRAKDEMMKKLKV